MLAVLAHYPGSPLSRLTVFSSPAALLGSILFGAMGIGTFLYGKRMVRYKPMVIGVAHMAYPYFVPKTWLMCTIGCAPCLGLCLFQD